MSAGDPAAVQTELARLARELHETQRRIAELAGGEIDAVVDPSGFSYLLPHAQERLRKDEEDQRGYATERAAILDALPAHIALLNPDGRIVAVNEAWRRFATANELQSSAFCIGQDYLEVCESSYGVCADEAHAAGLGIRSVLDGAEHHFALEYPCHSSDEQRWFRLMVTPLDESHRSGAVVMHLNITDLKLAEEALQQSQSLLRMASKISRLGGWSIEVPSMAMTWSDEVRAIHELPDGYTPSLDEGLELYAPEYREPFLETFRACLRDGIPYDLEVQKLTAYGRRIWIRTIGEAVRDSDGQIIRVQGAIQDISERKRAEDALRQSEFLLRIAGKVARVGGWAVELPSRQVYWSDETCDMMGCRRGEVPSLREAFSRYTPRSRALLESALNQCLERGEPVDLELELIAREDQPRWVRCRGEAEYDDAGAIRRIHGAFQDITQHKEAQLREIRLAGRLTSTLESITDAFFTLDQAWRITYINKEAERLLDRSRAHVLGKVLWDEFPEAAHTQFDREYRRAVADGVPVEFEEFFPPLRLWVGVRAFPTPDGLAVYFSDISERREARKALLASEERFRLFSKATNDAIWDWDLTTDARWWNDGLETLFGYTIQEVEPDSQSWTSRIHPDERDLIVADIRSVIDGGGAQWSGEYRFLRKNGSYAYVLDRGHIIRAEDGTALRMIGGMTDMTDRREAEARLAEQAALLDLASDAIIVRDFQHRVLFWNRGAEKIYGWHSDEVLNRSVADLLYEDTGEFLKATAAVSRKGEWSGELLQRRKEGEAVTVFGRWTLVRDTAGKPGAVLAINTDITDRKRMEQQLYRAQRMESIGTLAGGIAHDLNNVLAPILMASEILKDKVVDANGRDMLETISDSAQRGADLIQQVLSFARGIEGNRITLNPLHIVRDVQKVIQETFPRNITWNINAPRDLWTVNADATQLHQVLMNLCVNARDAMPNGGKLDISLSNIVVDEVYTGMHLDAAPGQYVLLKVEDSGTGIPKHIQENIFEPFFTTKELGMGTGLGLSTTFKIVRDHGGFINLYSEPGKGAKFKVYLPAANSAGESELGPAGQGTLPCGNGELILVVDDEENIRDVTKRVLERFGYRVVLAANGAEGVSAFVRHRANIALVLTDMSMPIMDGPAMIVALRSLEPSLRIIGSSGMTINANVAKAMGAGVVNFVPKPYTAEALLTRIRDMLLDTPAPGAVSAEPAAIVLARLDAIERTRCCEILEAAGYRVMPAASSDEARALIDRQPGAIRLVIADAALALPAGSGLAGTLAQTSPAARMLIVTDAPDALPTIREALEPEIEYIAMPFSGLALVQKVNEILGA